MVLNLPIDWALSGGGVTDVNIAGCRSNPAIARHSGQCILLKRRPCQLKNPPGGNAKKVPESWLVKGSIPLNVMSRAATTVLVMNSNPLAFW
jgi:hypothetical protein